MSTYVLKDEKNKLQQEAEDQKIDRRYHWFIFMFVMVSGLAVLALILSYFNGAFEPNGGFFGFNDTVRNVVWTIFTALFIFWALLVSIIRVREAYYEAEDYRAFARLSVIQFFYLWASLLALLFVLVSATVLLLFPVGSAMQEGSGLDTGFTLTQDIWLGISPFFIFYLLSFFSYCYLVFMLSFGYVKDLEIFESGKNSEEAKQIRNIELGLRRILERLESTSAASNLSGYPLQERQMFSGTQSNPVSAVSNSNALRATANSLRSNNQGERARSLFPANRQVNNDSLPVTNSFAQSHPVMPGSPVSQGQPAYTAGAQGQVLPQASMMHPSNSSLAPDQTLQQNSNSAYSNNSFVQIPANNNFNRGNPDPSVDPRFNYSSPRLDQVRDYYNADGAPSQASQEWMANSLNTLSLPQPIRGAGGHDFGGGQAASFNSPSGAVGVSPAQNSWDSLLGADVGNLRGRRRIR